MKYVYIESEPGLFTVGFFDPSGKWFTDKDFNTRDQAVDRVGFLNGSGTPLEQCQGDVDVREYFAAMAISTANDNLTGLTFSECAKRLGMSSDGDFEAEYDFPKLIAITAYRIADAMMEERENHKS